MDALKLEQELRGNKLSDLADAMPRIQDFVEDWWRQNYLPWFTDHGPDHSRVVADYALQLASSPNLSTGKELEPLEAFILWASSWLHDLGMQSLLNIPLGQLEQSDYEAIRKRHPDQSHLEIHGNATKIGLPPQDRALLHVIALVARAHGTNYYEDSVAKLRQFTLVRGKQVRGPLLAAILLMADELHLHYERVKPLPAGATLNFVSEAHALKHRVVLASEILHQLDGEVGIRITTQQDANLDDLSISAVETWIAEKLLMQVAKVEGEFNAGFRMQARLSRAIEFVRIGVDVAETAPLRAVMDVIEADNQKSRLINHLQSFEEAYKQLKDHEFVVLTGGLAEDFTDLDGREDLLNALGAKLRSTGMTVLSSLVLLESAGAASCTDVLVSWVKGLPGAAGTAGDDVTTADREVLLDILCGHLAEHDSSVLLVLSSIDLFSDKDAIWLMRTALPRLQEACDMAMLVSGEPSFMALATSSAAVEVSVKVLDYTDVGEHLARYSSRKESQNAANARRGYSEYKWTRDYAKLGLAEDTWYDHLA